MSCIDGNICLVSLGIFALFLHFSKKCFISVGVSASVTRQLDTGQIDTGHLQTGQLDTRTCRHWTTGHPDN